MSIDVFPSMLLATLQNPLPLTQGGTGATTAANARTNLGLGTLATQDASAVAITGGTATGLTNVTIGALANAWALDIANALGGGTLGGIHIAVLDGTNRWNLYSEGTAPNYLQGNTGIGGIAEASTKLVVTGTARVTSTLQAVRASLGMAPTNNALSILYAGGAGAVGIDYYPVADNGQAHYFRNAAAGAVGSISTTATATAYNTSSDVRLKHAIAPLAGALDAVAALKPVRFRWNADDSVGHGFLAHELQATIPEAVSGEPDAINDDGSVKPQQVDHSKLVPWLTAAVQALAARVVSLEDQLGI